MEDLTLLSKTLCHVFSTTGFAYLVKSPLSFSHADVFGMAKDFFNMANEKAEACQEDFVNGNTNTYQG